MKEFVLFPHSEVFPKETKARRISSDASASAFQWIEVQESEVIHEFILRAERASELEVVIFQNIPAKGKVWIRIRCELNADSRLRLFVVQNGGESSQVDIESIVLGQGARLELRGLQNAKSSQKFSTSAKVVHDIPHTSSDLQVWCAARDQARSVFKGSVLIGKGAHHTEAFQKNHNLMLSKSAVVDSFPKLFIENDNVKCSHGSTTSTIEPEQLVYLQSRGIDSEIAENMLVQGFLRRSTFGLSDLRSRDLLYSRLGIQDEEWS